MDISVDGVDAGESEAEIRPVVGDLTIWLAPLAALLLDAVVFYGYQLTQTLQRVCALKRRESRDTGNGKPNCNTPMRSSTSPG